MGASVRRSDKFIRFRLRKLKQRGYLETRVQLDHARQRERGKQRAGSDESLQDSCRWRTERAAIVLRLEQCGVTSEQLDHICGLEVLRRKFDVPIYCNVLTAEAVRYDNSFERVAAATNWRIFATGAEFSICDFTVQTFPVPHDRLAWAAMGGLI